MAAQSNAQQTFEELVAAVKQAESRGKRYAADGKTLTTSPKGALGEMQVMPATIKDPGFGVIPAKSSSPDEIARVGKDYLQAMTQKYGDTEKALIAYNWGPGSTDKWIAAGAKPEALPAETRTYVQRVKGFLGKDVSRETTVAKKDREPLPESLPPMAKAPESAKTTTVAKASSRDVPDIKSLPASYQAAFALAALADAKDDEDDKAFNEFKETEAEKLLRDYKPVNYLASLDLSVQPIMMNEGGEVEDSKRADDINYFSNVNRMKDRGTTTDSVMLGASKKVGEGSLMAGLNMANMSRDEKLQTARALMLAYTQQDPEGLGINANIVKPEGFPAMANVMGSLPLGDGRVSAGMHGNKAYSLGYNRPVEGGQFDANLTVPRGTMGSPQLNMRYEKRFADGGEVGEDLSKPYFGNPNIRKQGEAARRLAALRDVNTLPDPKTYAAVTGVLGTPPDKMGFSVMHPKYKEIMDVANPAFAAGTALQIAPVAQGPGMGRMVGAAEKALEPAVRRTLEGGGKAAEMLQALAAPPSQMFVRARPEAAARHAELQAKGLSPEEIRAQNLTMVDNRGNLIEEISDAPATLKQKTASTLRNYYEMLNHPELKSIYPTYDMPDVLMETTRRKKGPRALGTYNVQENMIMGKVRDLPGDDARNTIRGTLLHEGQHAIQSMEGFTEGANPGAFIAYVKARQGKYNPDPTVNENVIREMERAYPNIGSVADDFTTRFKADKYMQYAVNDPDRYIGETLYRHMPGEVQAELARVRSNLSPEQLKATPHEVSMQQLGIDPKNILEMNKMGSRPDRQIGDVDYNPYAHGGVVHRANGGEAEPTAEELAAASTPAFIAQKSGIGRKAGNISKALNTGTAYPAIAQGTGDVPYDLAGLPVDLTTMAMRPFGYKNEKPFLGSEYLKEKATEAGIRRPTPTDPTLKGFHYLGEFGAGVLAPGKIIEGAQALKGKAAEALAGFKAGRAQKQAGMTDMMTGQRVAAPEITPQMETEFAQWHQQAVNGMQQPAHDPQAVTNAIFDNLAGVNQQQIAADVAAGRLPGSVAPVPALLREEQNIARLPTDAQEQLRLFEEGAARPRPFAQTRPATQLPPPPPFVEPPVQISAEFPFVGRLDEFAASMKGPAQKEQLINQVKGKFREHDVARLEEALANLGPKDKVTPAMLQESLANTYSPSRFRSADVSTDPGGMYNVHDNIFHPYRPIAGSMNLYLKETPEAQQLFEGAAAVKKAAEKVLYGRKPDDITIAAESLRSNPLAAKVPEINALADRMENALPAYTKFDNMQEELRHARNMVVYPILYKENGFDFYREIERRVAPLLEGMTPAQRAQAMFPLRKEAEIKLIGEMMQKGSDKLVALGGEPVDVVGFMQRNVDYPSPTLAGGNDKVLQEQVKDIAAPIQDGINAALRQVRENIHTAYDKAYEKIQPYTGYKGQHETVTNKDINPIGFSRYTVHAVDMDGKNMVGRHVHELQSDLAQDVRELGHKGRSVEKDREELAALKTKFNETDELDPTQALERAKLDKRIDTLERRISVTAPGKYLLEQPFAGFETSPSVEMQLLMKNAIQSTMRAGQDFVTFPGKESAKPKLYEKVLPNLKQAVKDLGGEKAGFDIKPITLPNPGKNEPTVWGVVWSPETAAKTLEKGIPFKKGGMVERKTDDNRRYL